MHCPRVAALLCCLLSANLSAQTGRDLSKLDACKILTPADVAAATKGKVMSSVGGGVGGLHCMHVVDAQSASGSYQLFLQPPAAAEALWKLESAAERGTLVSGLWSEAYVGAGVANQFVLTALHRGDMAIEVHGPSKDVVIALAKLAVSRLK
jgi:hypothetical protein